MRHLRLHRDQKKAPNPGGFLEPVAEELEVSSVDSGSGSVRTKLSRKPSEETLCAVTAGAGQATAQDLENAVAELCSDVIAHAMFELQKELEAFNRSGGGDSDVTVELNEWTVRADVNGSPKLSEESTCENSDSGDLASLQPSVLVQVGSSHLSILASHFQDSFELEEIGTDEGERGDEPSPLLCRKKLLKRDNSGDSSGFDEELASEKGVSSSQVCTETGPSETSREISRSRNVDSPQSKFAQRRSRSLIKQRPVDSEDEVKLGNHPSRDSSVDTFTTCVEELPVAPHEASGGTERVLDEYWDGGLLSRQDGLVWLPREGARDSDSVASEGENKRHLASAYRPDVGHRVVEGSPASPKAAVNLYGVPLAGQFWEPLPTMHQHS